MASCWRVDYDGQKGDGKARRRRHALRFLFDDTRRISSRPTPCARVAQRSRGRSIKNVPLFTRVAIRLDFPMGASFFLLASSVQL